MNYEYELVTDATLIEENNKVLREGIIGFNEPFIGSKPDKFSVYVKYKENIVGGAIVYAHRKSVYVDILWVKDKHRGEGIGAKILKEVEKEAHKRGISESTLDTFSFQAEQFYLKQGYKHLGTIKNYIEGHDRIFMRKKL